MVPALSRISVALTAVDLMRYDVINACKALSKTYILLFCLERSRM